MGISLEYKTGILQQAEYMKIFILPMALVTQIFMILWLTVSSEGIDGS